MIQDPKVHSVQTVQIFMISSDTEIDGEFSAQASQGEVRKLVRLVVIIIIMFQ